MNCSKRWSLTENATDFHSSGRTGILEFNIHWSNMESPHSFLTKEQFVCSICLDVFTHPVTIPCGHNFCKCCITRAWEINGKCQCPLCKDVFERKPRLQVNTVLSEMADQCRKSVEKKASRLEQKQAKGGVPCDLCPETKQKAFKSCLECLASYCESHLEPHHRIPGLKRHKLIDPVENMEDRMCKSHDRPVEVFCKTDQMYVCRLCITTDHKRHIFIPLIKEYELKKAELGKTEAEIQHLILERQLKIQQIKQSVKLSKEDADREKDASVQILTTLVQSVQRGMAQLTHSIEERHKTTERQAKDLIQELEEEITELKKKSAEVELLSHTEDHLELLQKFQSLSIVGLTRNWSEVRVHSSYEDIMMSAMARLEGVLSKEMKELFGDTGLRRVQKHAVEVTLDPDTAHPALILSEDMKHVSCGNVKQNLPNNPERFSSSPCVLARQSFSTGRFYYEVQVQGKTRWDIGVAKESVNRKGHVAANPMTGLWIVCLKNGNEYRALETPGVSLSLKSKPQNVGVFVDYDRGLVSFYDVDAASHIYSFTGCNFTERLFPVFCPGLNDGGKNSAPLVISPVTHTGQT